MAIVGNIVVESRRYSGWIDSRYPIGYWFAKKAVTGNVTGGSLAIDLLFQTAAPGFLNSQLYSVERLGITSNEVDVTRNVRVTAINMSGPSNIGFDNEYSVLMSSQNGLNASAMSASAMVLVPWFLGSPRNAGISATLSLVTENLDGVTFNLEAEGYRWAPRSVLVDGGPQRPPTGPYRQ